MNETGQTVFDGRQNAIRGLIVDRIEQRLEGCSRHKRDVFTKEFDRGLFTKCASGALKSDAQCFLALDGKSRRSWFTAPLGRQLFNTAVPADESTAVARPFSHFPRAHYSSAT